MKRVDSFSWLAGVIDVSGGFGIQTNENRKYGKFSLGSTNLELVSEVATLLGADVTFAQRTTTGKDYWQVRLTGKKAVALGMILYKHVGEVRQQQISRMIEAVDS